MAESSPARRVAVARTGLRSGMIFPGGAFDGVDDPAERDTPSVVFLALGEHGAEAVLGRQDFAAEQDGFGRVRAGKVAGHADIGHQILGGRKAQILTRS